MRRVPLLFAIATACGLGIQSSTASSEELPTPPRPSIFGLEEISNNLASGRTGSRLPKTEKIDPNAELITERYPNRAIKVQRYVVQDADRNYVNHGSWTMMDPQGRIEAQGEYRNGKRHGSWMRVLQEFAVIDPQFRAPFVSQAEFDQGVLNGMWTITDAQQRVVGSWAFTDGQLHGASTTWYPNGQQRREMKFVNGAPDGEAVAWRPNGQVWAKEFFREGKQLVPVITWHDQKQKESEGWMVRSNFSIDTTVNWWDGQLEIARVETEGEDVKTGTWTEWYADGNQKFTGKFDRGDAVGEHIWWHENGQKMLVGVYRNGLAYGRWTQWFATGMKQEEGTYLAGVKSGQWTTWSDEGQVVSVQNMDDDTQIASDEDEPTLHSVSDVLAP